MAREGQETGGLRVGGAGEQAEDGREVFARLLGETGVSDLRFARLVNDRARDGHRVALSLHRTTVGCWRRGVRPRDRLVARVAAEQLSALVGYDLAPADLGWRVDAGDPGGERADGALVIADSPQATLRVLAGLAGRDMRRRGFFAGAAFTAAAFGEPALRALTDVVEPVVSASAASMPPTAAMIRDMAAAFRRVDASYGGRDVRGQVVGFLHEPARAALGGPHSAELFSALGEISELAGWLAHDGRRDALGQRYYVQALALAEHAGDHQLAGGVLAAMSDQATHLGQARHGLALARAAAERTRGRAPAGLAGLLGSKQALARLGDERGCTQALSAVERAAARAEAEDGPAWASWFGEADIASHRGWCLAMLGRHRQAEASLLEALQRETGQRRRYLGCVQAMLGISHATRGEADLEAALAAGHRALDLVGGVGSRRAVDRIGALDQALAPHAADSVAVRQWRQRARPLLAAAA
jgi:hypothetical protein